MTLSNTWRTRALLVGTIWSVVHISTLSIITNLSWLRNLEFEAKDRLLRLDVGLKHNKSQDITIIGMQGAQDYGLDQDPMIYAELINNILDENPKGVVLNLPLSIATSPGIGLPLSSNTSSKTSGTGALDLTQNSSSKIEDPIKNLLDKSGKILVLTARWYEIPGNKIVLPTYNKYADGNKFLLDEKNKNQPDDPNPLITVQGFFEFFPNFDSENRFNPIRYPYRSKRKFYLQDEFDKQDNFLSVTCLAAKKFQLSSDACNKNKTFQSNFWESKNSFYSIPINQICEHLRNTKRNCRKSIKSEYKNIEGKIVLVDFPVNDPYSFDISSPFGKLSPVQMQANLLASIINNSFYNVLGWIPSFGIIVAGGGLVVFLFSLIASNLNKCLLKHGIIITLGIPIIYSGAIILIAYFGNLIIPIVLPILTWVAIGNTTSISLLVWRYQERTSKQKQKLIEQTAIISETQKLLSRVATDIHDSPLQDLKLVMDRLEEIEYENSIDLNLLRVKHSKTASISLVDKLAEIGQDIRDHLNDIQTIAQKKWTISSELTHGLAAGIEDRLNLLVQDGKLILKVTKNISPLKEPTLDITWINAREDIFRFFKEAINNVMKHAQLSGGDATEVVVLLKQEGNQCILTVINNGSQSAPSRPNGTGTKTMETIAAGLPNGGWERKWLPEGGVSVNLVWTMPSG